MGWNYLSIHRLLGGLNESFDNKLQFNFSTLYVADEVLVKLPSDDCHWTSLMISQYWCRQATGHYLGQCWRRSLSPYGVTRPTWVCVAYSFSNKDWHTHFVRICSKHVWNISYFVNTFPILCFINMRHNLVVSGTVHVWDVLSWKIPMALSWHIKRSLKVYEIFIMKLRQSRYRLIYQHIGAEAKWWQTTFSPYFLVWKLLYLDSNFSEMCFQWSNQQ